MAADTYPDRDKAQSEPAAAPAAVATELLLLRILCQVAALNATEEAARLCSKITDWETFAALARHHRVLPLVAANATKLGVLPSAVREQLGRDAAANAVEAFRYVAELERLLSALAAEGIRPAVLKGIPLSLLAFKDISLRDVGDIDLLIAPDEAKTADKVLTGLGYLRKEPAAFLTRRRQAFYQRHFKDYTYEPVTMQTRGGFEVDLHWRLFRNAAMPGSVLGRGPWVEMKAGPMRIRTLAHEPQLLYLAVQGAVDGWPRLKSVADFAALWAGCDQAVVLRAAEETATVPYLAAALVLAEEWIGGLEMPASLDVRTPLVRHILSHARRRLAAYLDTVERRSSWREKGYEASLHSGWRYQWSIVQRVLFRPRVWSRFDLPDALFFLFPLLSPWEWLLFRLQSKTRAAKWRS